MLSSNPLEEFRDVVTGFRLGFRMRAATCTTAPAVCPSPGPKANDDSEILELFAQIIAAPNLFAVLGL